MTDFQRDSDPELDALREEVETLRMQLTACGVAARCNTRSTTLQHRLVRGHPYWCSAYQDVCDAVCREIDWREKFERLLKDYGEG